MTDIGLARAHVRTPPADLRPVLEALLVVSDVALDAGDVAAALSLSLEQVSAAFVALAADYESPRRGMRLRHVQGGWRLFAAAEHRAAVEAVLVDQQPARLTRAALETLAIVAYRQPISRARIAAIRGVSVDAVVRTLVSRGLIGEQGSEDGTGAHLYGTTPALLDRLGIQSTAELPSLAPYLAELDLDEVLDG